ncbi:D-tyrosyl-tRNA(Tyr) deacylase [Tissierella praeacuta DSM 18095]|uniref:D-aminoacyl-tRNA deacylase n=1 Tax=Tissierella praeacuta DSM 18095 TaxID=1123404 RepID=A0A1M4ZEG5_9FIRM|nr:D-aminoacyl-tRNA deacylase [Tissierella praeacuta]TCU65376.1 D-tyrosyl-tRNA(Tyr) deacylase [Tissierella praeacuta]SHF16345.1 D-tyrosyl-tRNA(Tyr) deacylase [Tissierella praeacuta DSM 18095]SUP01912.1 D-tyrosyl-tRNA(Tyr) deacylase [Tissierella praeacuta]
MRAVVQRVSEATVRVDNKVAGEIGKGLLVFLGIGEGDTEKDLEYLVDKVLGLRIFQDENDKMNLSLLDINGEILVISQFTLYGDVRKGKRPSFTDSAHPDIAERMYLEFIDKCKTKEIKTEKGIFGADMKVSLVNDGPVTILLDSKKLF